MEELSELANGNAGDLPVLENCTGFYLSSPSGMDSQNWGYCGKDAASTCSPSTPSSLDGRFQLPSLEASFILRQLLCSWPCSGGHRLPMDGGLWLSLIELPSPYSHTVGNGPVEAQVVFQCFVCGCPSSEGSF